MHTVLKAVARDQIMAYREANHIQAVCASDEDTTRHGLCANTAAFQALGLEMVQRGEV